MKKILLLLFIFAIGLNLTNAFCQETVSDRVLTLEECIDVALKKRPELQMATMDILNSEYQVKEATSYYYPHLNLFTGYTRFNRPERIGFDVDITEIKHSIESVSPFPLHLPSSISQEVEIGKTNWYSVSVDLNQPVYTFGRIEEGIKQARIGRVVALNQKEKKKEEIVFEVKKAYYQLLLTKELFELAKDGEGQTSVVVKMVKIAYETSIPEKDEKGTTRLDYLKARNFYSELKARLSEVEKNFKLAELGLKLAMGLDPSAPLKAAKGSLESLPVGIWNLGEIKEKTLNGNIDLKNLKLGVDLYDSKRRAANKEYFPKIGIQGQYVGPEDRFGTPNFWYAGIGLTMPIFDGFATKAKIGQAEAQLLKAKSQKALLESGLVIQIDHLNTNLMELKERSNILRAAIGEAQERTQLAADGYSAGITDYEELLLAQKNELEMKSAYLQSLYLYQMIKSEIEFLSGSL